MDSLVSTEWLARELGAADLKVIDASSHLPAVGRNAGEEFAAGHIPGALFLDLAGLKDAGSSVPNALPTAQQFAQRMTALGISADDRVVIYDDSDVKTSSRAWFILRMNGLRNIAILDGGLGKWKAEGRPLESGASAAGQAREVEASGDWSRVRTKAEMLANIDSGAEQVIDARDAGRFTAETADAIHGLAGGHIPGARNLFFRDLLNPDGTFRSDDELRAAFERAGIDLSRPIVTSCGSGVTASVLLFALHRLGVDDAALYDGSWSEWGADPSTPKESGAAA
ncbi:thiosulfate sulfurtransferase [Tsuneonella deserti]|uniref:Sulfurtransferase n=1 Tax=Tsuneonella deserti TaxID=2035528 RepID=A0ABQ1S8J3_9SPHN|nr:3-mercaptopyruvate sulfurtransferase [Tsuneonella deserti]GGD98161.1 thiosulfate sulfurtransferase [Tsuneonella deserti]